MEDHTKETSSKPKGGVLNGIWGFFTSLKLTVTLLIILALVSIIGTVIDQGEPMKNMKMLVGLFGPDKAGSVLALLVKTGMTNMYHSWWFVGLLSLLSLNIAICTIDRFPRVWHMVTKAQTPLTDDVLKTLGLKREIKAKGSKDIKEKARAAMKSMGYSPREAVEGGFIHLYAEKGKFSRLGVYITHTSVLVIFMGAIIGSFWGYKAYVQIVEGQSIDSVTLINKPLLKDVGSTMPLGFDVRCDKFVLKMYGTSEMPSDYLSTLTVVDAGKEMMGKTIRVNDPLEYKSIRFYQSSYGVQPGMATMTIRASNNSNEGDVHDYKMRKDEKVHLEGSDYDMVLVQLAPDVEQGPGNQLIATSDQFKGSAAAAIRFLDRSGQPFEETMIVSMDPRVQPKKVNYNFRITGYNGPYYTGLQVTYDPGVWVVWIGCMLMVFGILVAFFTFHKRVWVRIQEGDKGQVTVLLAGATNKNRHAFEGEFRQLAEKIESK